MTASSAVLAPPAPSALRRRRLAATTPGRFRLLSLVAVFAIVVAAAVSSLGAAALSSSTDRVRTSSAPALVATQEVFSSLAEADAAATAAYLSGTTEDREQRRQYEDALARSSQRLTEVARLVGGSADGRAAAQDLAAKIATYAGLVETARTYNLLNLPGGEAALQQAIDLVRNGIAPDVAALTTVTQKRFNADDGAGRPLLWVATGLIGLAAAVLIALQLHVARASRRVFNLPLVVATILLAGVGAWAGVAVARQSTDMRNARNHGYASVQLTGRIQTLAYRAKADRALALALSGSPTPATPTPPGQPSGGQTPPGQNPSSQTPSSAVGVDTGRSPEQSARDAAAAVEELAKGVVSDQQSSLARTGGLTSAAGQGLLFDVARAAGTPRERAAAAEMLTRWSRYDEQQRQVDAARQAGRRQDAVSVATGPGSNTFNGFNLAVESVLRDNTTRFNADLSAAQQRLAWLRPGLVVMPLLAALLVLWGLQLRINEYR